MLTITRIIPTRTRDDDSFTFTVLLDEPSGAGTFFLCTAAELKSYSRLGTACLRRTGRLYEHHEVERLGWRDAGPAWNKLVDELLAKEVIHAGDRPACITRDRVVEK